MTKEKSHHYFEKQILLSISTIFTKEINCEVYCLEIVMLQFSAKTSRLTNFKLFLIIVTLLYAFVILLMMISIL